MENGDKGTGQEAATCWGRDDIGQVWTRKLLEGEDQHLHILVSPNTPVMVHYLILGEQGSSTEQSTKKKKKKHKEWFKYFECYI